MSMASLDHRKYSWYPNKQLDPALSTYTVSPTPKRFDLQPQQDQEMGEINQSSTKLLTKLPRSSVVNFDGGV
jgi:hypothetical protein